MPRRVISIVGAGLLSLLAYAASAQVSPPAGEAQPLGLASPDSKQKVGEGGAVREPLIQYKKGNFFKDSKFSLDGKNFDPVFEGQVLQNALAPVPSAARQYRSARSTHNGAYMLAIVGGAVAGVAVGWGIMGNEGWSTTSTAMLAGGLAVSTGALFLDASAGRRAERAVDEFNSRSAPRVSIQLGVPRGIPGAVVRLQF